MKPSAWKLSALLFSLTAAAGFADVVTTDPSFPVLYPTGEFTFLPGATVTFNGAGLTIVLGSLEQRPSGPVIRTPSGANELENFSSTLLGVVSVNGSPFLPGSATGPAETELFGYVGQVTGTFPSEMLAMNLSGTSPFGPFMLRESPTLASVGQTTVTDLGGGQYNVNSFFDVFTELSLDGGASWIPSAASARMTLVPEPSQFLLMALGGFGLALWQYRQKRAARH
jgi:hypothetical protein